jgi:hypothetical protein
MKRRSFIAAAWAVVATPFIGAYSSSASPIDEAAARHPSVRFSMGPPMSYFEDERGRHVYVTLCQTGIKPEGAAMGFDRTEADAWGAYWAQLDSFLAERNAKAVSWRIAPTAEYADWRSGDRRFYIRSRLVVTERFDG